MMSVLFFGSEIDKRACEIAGQLKKDFSGIRFVKSDDPNGMLGIKDDDVILVVAPSVENPKIFGMEDFTKGSSKTLNSGVLCPFLEKMQKIGRLSNVRVIGIPVQVDDGVVSSLRDLD